MKVINGVLHGVTRNDLKDGQFIFPEGVTAIGEKAFYHGFLLTSITIPECVISIGDSAFSNCKNLVTVNIPESVTDIGQEAFLRCFQLTSITIPKSVVSIGNYAFDDCDNLESIIMPEGVVYPRRRDGSAPFTYIDTETQESYERTLALLPQNIQNDIQKAFDFFEEKVKNLLAVRNRDKGYLSQNAIHNAVINRQLKILVKQYGIPTFRRDEIFQKYGLDLKRTVEKKDKFSFGKINFFKEQSYTNEDIRGCKQQLDALKSNIEKQRVPDLDEANKCLADLVLLKENIENNKIAFIDKGVDMAFEVALDDSINKLMDIIVITKRINATNNEMEGINSGAYQYVTRKNSYGFQDKCKDQDSLLESWDTGLHIVYPLIYESGLRATIATKSYFDIDSDSVEIEINFLGTVDFASKLVDLDDGGPGQVALKQHETKLLEQVNHVMEQMAAKYPDKTLRLRISGHSLGGALAKGFAHTMQRACAVVQDKPDTIIDRIKKEWVKDEYHNPAISFDDLKMQLEADKDRFKDFKALNNISGITVYALGAPGVSDTTDKLGTLLTYYHDPDFLRMYHHHHKEDIMVKFGDSEFLSGNNGTPRMLVNKAITYDIKITADDEKKAGTLPFPNVTPHVMAAHTKSIQGSNVEHVEITELEHSKEILDKYVFFPVERLIYNAVFFFGKYAASYEAVVEQYPELRSLPVYDVGKPAIG